MVQAPGTLVGKIVGAPTRAACIHATHLMSATRQSQPKRPIAHPMRGPLLALAVFVGMCVLLEGGARLVLGRLPTQASARFALEDVWDHGAGTFHEADPDLTWRQVPGYRDANVRINALGMRGPQARTHDEGVRRILVLGDSIAFGYALPEHQTYPRLLERELGLERTEVLNAAVIGYSSFQGRQLFERLLPSMAPDLVVVQFGYNDHHSARFSDRERLARDVAGWHSLVRGTGVARLARRVRGRDATLREEPVARVCVADYRSNLLAMRDMAQAKGSSTLFLTTPLRPHVPLVENFTRLQPAGQADSEVIWVPQIDVALGFFDEPARAAVQSLFLGGDAPGSRDLLARPHNVAIVERLVGEFSELAVGHYLHALSLAARSAPPAAVAASEQSWRALDSERTAIERYNTALRELAAAGELELCDLAAAFSEREPLGSFRDVVHPSASGHAFIAAELLTCLEGR